MVSSVHSILKTLESENLLEKKNEAGKYNLGLKLIELGNLTRFSMEIGE